MKEVALQPAEIKAELERLENKLSDLRRCL